MSERDMKAALYYQYGGPEVLQYEVVPIPEIRDDEILIRVAATSVNPVDKVIQAGLAKHMAKIEFPHIVGLDVAGMVEQIGESVKGFRPGDRVYAFMGFSRNGAAADYVACKESVVAYAPTSIPISDVAALPGTASAAWQGLFSHGGLQAGHRVLITAASGGVGTIAVQLAKWKGAYVIGTAVEKKSFKVLKELGIDEVIDYKKDSILEVVKEPMDLIFNLSPVDTSEVNKLLTLLKPGGFLVSGTQPADDSEAERLKVRTIRMGTVQSAEQLTEVAKLVDSGFVRPYISERLPIGDIAEAYKKLGRIAAGKILLVVDEKL